MKRKACLTLSDEEETEQTAPKQKKVESTFPLRLDYGKVLWAKLGKFPWWPCIVSKNPKVYHIIPKKPKIYVIFFGPTTQHSWVTESSVLEYSGLNSFKAYAQEQVNKARTKSSKDKAVLRYNLKIQTTLYNDWQAAVEQADEALIMPKDERIQHFFCPKTEDSKIAPTNDEIRDKKRVGVMALLENTIYRLGDYSVCFCLEEMVIIRDYFGPEYENPELGVPDKDFLFERFEYVRKTLENIFKERIASHGNTEHFKADYAILRALRAIKENIPMLEIDFIHRYLVMNPFENRNSVYERLYELKHKLFENRSNLNVIETILDEYYKENPETNQPTCSKEL